MKTAVERAEDLLNKFGKEVAIKVVYEIQKCVLYTSQRFENDRFSENYWEEVKQELNKQQ
jgi:hypothetical protein